MNKIKLRQKATEIKALDKTKIIFRHMKNPLIKSKEKADETQRSTNDTPHAYATDTVTNYTQSAIKDLGHKAEKFGRNSFNNTPDNIRFIKSNFGNAKSEIKNATNEFKNARRSLSNNANKTIRKTVKIRDKKIKTIRKGTIKTTQKAVKSTERTGKVAIKTSQQTAKAAVKTAQATAKTAQKAAQAAKVAAKAAILTAKVTIKVAVTTVKALIAAIKGLIALIAAGGWVAILIILIICMIAFILSSPFGIFSGGGANQTPAIQEVVSSINSEWNDKVIKLKEDAGKVDETIITINNKVVTTIYITNWVDILSVFSVLIGTSENPANLAEMDSNKVAKLKEVFNSMNSVTSKTELVEMEDKTITKLTIGITSRTYLEMISVYNFNSEQQAVLNELMSEKNKSMFNTIINN